MKSALVESADIVGLIAVIVMSGMMFGWSKDLLWARGAIVIAIIYRRPCGASYGQIWLGRGNCYDTCSYVISTGTRKLEMSPWFFFICFHVVLHGNSKDTWWA